MLIFANGSLTLAGALCSGRYMVLTKSPLTGTICSSNAGGYFSAAFKASGYGLITVTGRSNRPCYLQIEDDSAALHDASAAWGLDTRQTTALLTGKSHRDSKVSYIDPAGENLVRFAAIMNDVNRAAARSGVGAVREGSYRELAGKEKIRAEVEEIVAGLNKRLARFETIKDFVLLDHDLTIEAGDLTPTMKVKRRAVFKKYGEQLKTLYS